MTWLIGFAASLLGPKFGKFAKPVVFAVLGLLIVAALWGGKCAYDRNIIKTHDAKQEAATAKADRKADTKAAEQRRTDDARITQERTELEGSTSHAQTNLDRRLAFQHCLRLQQSARAAKREPPSCA